MCESCCGWRLSDLFLRLCRTAEVIWLLTWIYEGRTSRRLHKSAFVQCGPAPGPRPRAPARQEDAARLLRKQAGSEKGTEISAHLLDPDRPTPASSPRSKVDPWWACPSPPGATSASLPEPHRPPLFLPACS